MVGFDYTNEMLDSRILTSIICPRELGDRNSATPTRPDIVGPLRSPSSPRYDVIPLFPPLLSSFSRTLLKKPPVAQPLRSRVRSAKGGKKVRVSFQTGGKVAPKSSIQKYTQIQQAHEQPATPRTSVYSLFSTEITCP